MIKLSCKKNFYKEGGKSKNEETLDFCIEVIMNKGLQIRNKKRSKHIAKANTKKPEQIGLCRFIDFKDIQHHKVNGRFVKPTFIKRRGLQIEHNFYYVQNELVVRSKINKKGARILKVYDYIPEWANPLLESKRTEFLLKSTDN